MFRFEPPGQQGAGRGRGADVARGAPGEDLAQDMGHERREKLFVSRGTKAFARRKPTVLGNKRGVRRNGKLGVQGHGGEFALSLIECKANTTDARVFGGA